MNVHLGSKTGFISTVYLSGCVCVHAQLSVCSLLYLLVCAAAAFVIMYQNKHILTWHQYKQRTSPLLDYFMFFLFQAIFPFFSCVCAPIQTHTHACTPTLGSCSEHAAERKRPTQEVSRRLAVLEAFTVSIKHTHTHTHTAVKLL